MKPASDTGRRPDLEAAGPDLGQYRSVPASALFLPIPSPGPQRAGLSVSDIPVGGCAKTIFRASFLTESGRPKGPRPRRL